MPRSLDDFCPGCGLVADHCACDILPRVELPLRFLIVQHVSELYRQSNTGRVLKAMLAGTTIHVHGVHPDSIPAGLAGTDAFEPPAHARLLFPLVGAAELRADDGTDAGDSRRTYVILDATWSQARRMRRRVPGLHRLPPVALPPGPPSTWPLRRAPAPGKLCTLEAGIRTVALHGFAREAREMERAMAEIGRRLFWSRGRRTNF